MKHRAAQFLQSFRDFPLTVRLGREAPSWELNRWGRDTLRFSPLEGGRFSLRGNKQYLQYTGRKESHRFTILDRDRFEYDIILKKEPESNTLYLEIKGWEDFDFFRQPDTVGPEVLRGSYAVYKKETVINSPVYHVGTGKLCHIHRPKIIDALGREVWGDVWIDRGIMVITIPEGWLGEAKYPVVVDPVIGSTTVGAYTTYKYLPSYCYDDWHQEVIIEKGSDYYTEELELELRGHLGLNKYRTPLPMSGEYNSRVYINKAPYRYSKHFYAPFIYTDSNNKPKNMLNTYIQTHDALVDSSNPAGWYSGALTVGSIGANTDIWFGFYGEPQIGLRFDYGAQFYKPCVEGEITRTEDFEYWYGDYDDPFLEYLNDVAIEDISDQIDIENDPLSDERNVYPGQRTDFKVSMYFEIVQQNYVRTITQGVTLTDSHKRVHGIVKRFTETPRVNQGIWRVYNTVRKAENTAGAHEEVTRERGMYRFITSVSRVTDSTNILRSIGRTIQDMADTFMEIKKKRDLERGIDDYASSNDTVSRSRGIFSLLQTLLGVHDRDGYSNQWGRNITDNTSVVMENSNTAEYIRELHDSPGVGGNTDRRADYKRLQQDTGIVRGEAKRMLGVFIKLVSGSVIRDYVISRFLKSKEEIQIKSKITREIVIESRID